MGTSYIPFPPWALFFCLVPLWTFWLNTKSAKQIFITGWIYQFVLGVIGFNWVAHTVHEFGRLPTPVSYVVLFLYCAIFNLHYPITGLIWNALRKRLKWSIPQQILVLCVLQSFADRWFPMLFDWHMGYAWFHEAWSAHQTAEIFGMIGLSNITVFINGLLVWAWLNRKQARISMAAATAAFMILLVLNVWGSILVKNWPATETVPISIVQANIGNLEKQYAEKGNMFRESIVDRYVNLSRQSLENKPQWIIWPETAYPEVPNGPSLQYGFGRPLKDLLEQNNLIVITGGYGNDFKSRLMSNSFYILKPSGEWMYPPYSKTVLLAFGEYLPFSDWYPPMREWFPETGHFSRGAGPTVFDVQGIKVGAQICYEGLFDWFSRDLAKQGAEVMINLTNDSWYGTWQQPYEHLTMTLSRSIETRLPLIRATNTGISTVVTAKGEVLTQSPLHQEWQGFYLVPYEKNPKATFFVRMGFWLFPLLLLALLVILVVQGVYGSTRLAKPL